MAATPASPLPERATAGQVAELLGVSERMILGRTSDGRLPRATEGGIDFRMVVRAGVDACASDQRERGRTGVNPREVREAAFQLQRLGPWFVALKAPDRIAKAALAVGIELPLAQALYREMLGLMPELGNEALKMLDTPHNPEIGKFERITHLAEPDWTGLAAEANKTGKLAHPVAGGKANRVRR